MDSAAAVEVRCGADAALRGLAAVLWAAAAALVSAWACALAGAPSGAQVAASMVGLLAGAVAWRHGGAATGSLRWDGGGWHWVPDRAAPTVEGALTVAVDLDAWLLLRFDAVDGRRRWIAVSRARHGARWHALRCAALTHGADARAVARLAV